jgi:hypothetical protein
MERIYWISLVIIGLFSACASDSSEQRVAVDWQLADSTAAAALIQQDTVDYFFEQITTTDMLLQMGAFAERPTGNRDSLLPLYRRFLAQQVRTFSTTEAEMLNGLMAEARRMVSVIHSDLFPQDIQLVKISGAAYGPSVYYTRERCIMIPANELRAENDEQLLQVLLHELFHVYSRYHPGKRQELYAEIGFTTVSDSVILPEHLRKRLLLNPDGVRWQQKIALQPPMQDSSQVYFPILYATGLERPTGDFFDHFAFGYFPVDSTAQGWLVNTLPKTVASWPSFRQKTGENTNYIIHPDEILADNFVLLVLRAAGYAIEVSPEGTEVLDRLVKNIQ